MNGEQDSQTPSTVPSEANVITIPPGSEALTSEVKGLTTGAMVTISGRITANDDTGLSLEVSSIEKVPDAGEAPTGKEPEAATAPASDTESPTGAADSYVAKRRQQPEMA